MSISDAVNIVGLLLGTIGAILLAYDPILGAGKRWKGRNIETQKKTLQDARRFARSMTENFAFSEPVTKKLIEAQDKDWEPLVRDLAKDEKDYEETIDEYENRVSTLGLRGVLLIVASFVIQIVAVFIHIHEARGGR